MKKPDLLIGLGLFVCFACNAPEKEPDIPKNTAELTPQQVQPIITTSGNSFHSIFESGNASNQTGYDYDLKYTLVEYVSHTPIDDLPLNAYTEIDDDEQLVKLNIAISVVKLRLRNCQQPDMNFKLIYEGKEATPFTQFTDSFKETLVPKCLSVGELQTVPLYFKISAEADLTNARLNLNRSSDLPKISIDLNPS